MAGGAIEAMHLEVFVKPFLAQELLERGFPHLRQLGKLHVVRYDRHNLIGLVVGHTQAITDGARHFRAHIGVAIEANPIEAFESGRLADIVQQSAPGERGRTPGVETFQEHAGVDPNVALGMKLRRLLDALHLFDLRQDLVEQARVVEKFESETRFALRKHLGKLVADAFAADLVDLWRECADRSESLGLNLIAKARGEANRAQQAQLVLSEAAIRIADGADNAGADIILAADVIEDAIAIERIHQETVDGEVAALDILFGSLGETDFAGVAAIGIGAIIAEGGDLYLAAIREQHEDYAELRTDRDRVRIERKHFLGSG